MDTFSRSAGFIPVSLVLNIVLSVLIIGVATFAVWAFMGYQDYKTNADSKIDEAVQVARQEQRQEDEAAFAEAEKHPTRKLTGPPELGAVSVDYPKTWSVYIEQDGGSSGQFEAYLHPGVVHALQSNRPYALRISVTGETYERVVASYDRLVADTELTASPVKLNDENGVRLDGRFSDEVQGSMVIFKVRDKTLRVFTESPSYRGDLNNIILPSLKFNR